MKKYLLVLFLILFCCGNVFALDKFPTGFYRPLENFTYSTAGTWLGPGLGHAGPHGHIGVDMLAPEGTSVYAVADGYIFRDPSPNGWGSGNVAVLVKHKLLNGGEFIVLYGHVTKSSALQKGAKVYAGKTIIGKLGPYSTGSHLHLGVVPPNTNYGPTYGYTTNANHNGFVDPIHFLNIHYPKNTYTNPQTETETNTTAYANSGQLAWIPLGVKYMQKLAYS